jgi:hypothetical protein
MDGILKMGVNRPILRIDEKNVSKSCDMFIFEHNYSCFYLCGMSIKDSLVQKSLWGTDPCCNIL